MLFSVLFNRDMPRGSGNILQIRGLHRASPARAARMRKFKARMLLEQLVMHGVIKSNEEAEAWLRGNLWKKIQGRVIMRGEEAIAKPFINSANAAMIHGCLSVIQKLRQIEDDIKFLNKIFQPGWITSTVLDLSERGMNNFKSMVFTKKRYSQLRPWQRFVINNMKLLDYHQELLLCHPLFMVLKRCCISVREWAKGLQGQRYDTRVDNFNNNLGLMGTIFLKGFVNSQLFGKRTLTRGQLAKLQNGKVRRTLHAVAWLCDGRNLMKWKFHIGPNTNIYVVLSWYGWMVYCPQYVKLHPSLGEGYRRVDPGLIPMETVYSMWPELNPGHLDKLPHLIDSEREPILNPYPGVFDDLLGRK